MYHIIRDDISARKHYKCFNVIERFLQSVSKKLWDEILFERFSIFFIEANIDIT